MSAGDDIAIGESLSFVDLLRILRRRAWVIVLTVAIFTVGPFMYALTLKPNFTATVSIIVEPPGNPVVDSAQVRPTIAPDKAAIESYAALLLSRDLALRTMDRLTLFADPEFTGEDEVPAFEVAMAWLRDRLKEGSFSSLLSWLDLSTAAAETASVDADEKEESRAPVAATPGDRDLAAEIFASKLAVLHSDGSYVLNVSFASVDPVKAAGIANALTTEFLNNLLSEKRASARRTTDWMAKQLPLQQQELLEAEQKIAAFRSEHQLLTGRAGSLTEAEMHEVNQSMLQARAARAEKEAKLRLVRSMEDRRGGVDSLADVLASSLISALRRREAELKAQDAQLATAYGIRHPSRQAVREEISRLSTQIHEEIGRVVGSLQNDIAVLAAQEASLQRQLTSANEQNRLDNEAGVRLQEMEREANAKRMRYENLLRAFQERSGQESILEAGARILARAEVPTDPSTPPPVAFAGVGFAVSAVFGCLLALLLEQSDKTLRRVRQVERVLQIPCLSLVPNVSRVGRRSRLHQSIWRQPGSAYPQAVRSLYVRLAATAPATRVLLVTSALPGEGKTSLASAIALCASQIGGARTLLIDGDLWRPRVSEEFALPPSVGVAELIAAETDDDFLRALRPVEREGIYILPAGLRPGDGSRKLTIQSASKLIAELRKRYDFIVIDSPPILGVNDGHILAMTADKALMTIRWGHTNQDAAVAALKILRHVSAQVLGVVLNRVDTHLQVHYGEGDEFQFHKQIQKYYGRQA